MILFSVIGVLVKIIVFALVLSLIICVHELGHFLSAKKFGILCHEFSLGMGPAIYKKKKGETTYAIRCIPIGGYVSMAGEQFTEDIISPGDVIGLNLENGIVKEIIISDKVSADIRGRVIRRNLYGKNGEALEIELTDDYSASKEELEGLDGVIYPVKEDAFLVDERTRMQIAPYNRCLESKPLWQRFITMFAGAFMNFVLAIVIYLMCAFIQGTPNRNSAKIGSIDNYRITEIAKGDVIESINGISVNSWNDYRRVMDNLAMDGAAEITIVLKDKADPIVVEPIIAVNSIGISNAAIKKEYRSITIPGAQVGRNGIRYKKSVSSKETQISNGDVIVAINVYDHGASYDEANWVSVNSWSDITSVLKDKDIANVYFRYYDCQTDEYHDTYVDNQKAETYGNEVLENQRIDKIRLSLGITATTHHNFFESVESAGKAFWSDFTLIFRTLKLIIHPTSVRQISVDNLSGVVGIYSMIGMYIKAGIVSLLLFMALLCVNLGVMNLLPIPALDGGRILFILIEAVTRKPLNRKVEAMINNIMFILILIFMVYIAYNDVTRIIR